MNLWDVCTLMAQQKLGLPTDYELNEAALWPQGTRGKWTQVNCRIAQRVPKTGRQRYDRWINEHRVYLYRSEIESFPGYDDAPHP